MAVIQIDAYTDSMMVSPRTLTIEMWRQDVCAAAADFYDDAPKAVVDGDEVRMMSKLGFRVWSWPI